MSETTLTLPGGLSSADCTALCAILDRLGPWTDRPDVPIIAPAMLLGTSEAERLGDVLTAPGGQAVVHESQSFFRRAPLEPGQPIQLTAVIECRAANRSFEFLLSEGGRELGGMQTRLRLVAPEEMATFKGSAFHPRLAPGARWVSSLPISGEDVAAYVRLAGDANPIHVDHEAARAVGLSGAIVPGMLMIGLAERAFSQGAGAFMITEMKTRFMAPVVVNTAVRFAVVPRGEGRARLFSVKEDDMIAAISDVTFSAR
ncbi:MaoC like domain-containing protein [Salinihabitans flavidus]|uniref:MaoC like domain-containing protein n=1 Tax=Salinihabitans flavidus TaxID=569882 RepID=A0A1H8S0E5_9RHOB|nr:MaoC family dehydratase [Salinihabitans flavidus]SEO72105.1 MaoC like domain-containing protein [Salinihabitans flavidus]